jgi:FMN reductase
VPETPEQNVRVAGLAGSIRPGSYTRMAVAAALDGATSLGVETDLIDLRDYDLGFAGGGGEEPEAVRLFSGRLKAADGIILGTPEYHGSISGVLKNALDLMGFAEFEGKMVGLVGVSGGRMGAYEALNTLRIVGRALHAWVVPEQAAIPEAWKAFDEAGRPTDPAVAERLREVGKQVARFARLHKCAAARDFLETWERAAPNPGG